MNSRFAICDWRLTREWLRMSMPGSDCRACGNPGAPVLRPSGERLNIQLRPVNGIPIKRNGFRKIFGALLMILLFTGCRREMFQQASSKPLEKSEFFRENQMASRPVVPNTVARGHLNEDDAFYTGKIGTNLVTEFPFRITREVMERGRQRFEIYCAPCHGRTGEGNGMIVQRGYPPPPSYHIERLRAAPVGHFYDVITHGYGVMYPYAVRVEPHDRWAIVAYIRALQLSRDFSATNLAADDLAKLNSQ